MDRSVDAHWPLCDRSQGRSYGVGGKNQKKKDRRVDVPTLQLAVLRCNRAVDRVCDFCEVKKDDDDLLVYRENGHVVERIDTDVWKTSTLSDTEVKDLDKIAGMINSAIAAEYGAL